MTDRDHKQKYQINSQLLPGTARIPFSLFYDLLPIIQASQLEGFLSPGWGRFPWIPSMEILAGPAVDGSELGTGGIEMAIL